MNSSVTDMIIYGKETIHYSIYYVNRKTLEIGVHPDGNVVIKAPFNTTMETIREKIVKRARWITKQLYYFRQFDPRTPARQYLGGETHFYLGKQYRLKCISAQMNNVDLSHDFIIISIRNKITPEAVKKQLDKWYEEKATMQFHETFEQNWLYFKKLALKKPALKIRRMQKRWGSLSKNRVLLLNIDLIRAPKECIEYVIIHELCHLQYNDHSRGFYSLLEKILPDWEIRKHKLESIMA